MKGRRKNLSMLEKGKEGLLTLKVFRESTPGHKPIQHPGFLLEGILFLQSISTSQDPLQEETQMTNHPVGHTGGHQEGDPLLQEALEDQEHQEAQEGQGIPLTLQTH